MRAAGQTAFAPPVGDERNRLEGRQVAVRLQVEIRKHFKLVESALALSADYSEALFQL
jgi:hypothetical protein